jgi:hypothetical protein
MVDGRIIVGSLTGDILFVGAMKVKSTASNVFMALDL